MTDSTGNKHIQAFLKLYIGLSCCNFYVICMFYAPAATYRSDAHGHENPCSGSQPILVGVSTFYSFTHILFYASTTFQQSDINQGWLSRKATLTL